MKEKYTDSPFLKVFIDKYKSMKEIYFWAIFGLK